MLQLLLEPLQFPFMVRGLAASVLVGILCAVVGCYVVLRGMAFFGDALSHTILPGLATGYLVSGGDRGSLFWWALGAAITSALGIGAITRNSKVREDTAIGIVFAGAFALGVALISTARGSAVDLTHLLFGDVLGVSNADLVRIVIFGSLIAVAIALFYKELLVTAFDPVLAITLRLPVAVLDSILWVIIAVAIVVAIQTVGVTLMLAALVTPAATAGLLTRRLPMMMALAALIASASAVVGLYVSYYLGVASGASIVLTCTLVFGLVWTVQYRRRRIQI